MKQLLVLLSLLLINYSYAETYQIKIKDKNKSLSKSIVIATVEKAFSLSCTEGVLNSADKTCTVTNQITRVEECPSGYINQGDGTCEATTTVSANKYCSSGTDTGSGCRVTSYKSATMSCPSGYGKFGNSCYKYIGFAQTCPSGYTYHGYIEECYNDQNQWVDPKCSSGLTQSYDRCYDSGNQTSLVANCSSGYTYNGSSCYKVSTYSYSYNCDSGFTLSGSLCTRTMTHTVGLTSCPEGYNEVSSELCEQVIVNPATISCPSGGIYDSGRDGCI